MTELFLNWSVADMIEKLNQEENWRGEPMLQLTSSDIAEKFYEMCLILQNEEFILFEYSYFYLKIAGAEYFIKRANLMADNLYQRLKIVLEEMHRFKNTPKEELIGKKFEESISFAEIKGKNKYVGPTDIDETQIEQEILAVLHNYSPHMDKESLHDLIHCADELKFDHLKIHLYEVMQEFDKCIETYLHSSRCERRDIFSWLFNLHRKRKNFSEHCMTKLKDKILAVIEDLVVTDSTKTGDIIDRWLPNSQQKVLIKLKDNINLQLKYLKDFLKERESDIEDQMK
jgi:septum formation topological specificity factor MinE